MSDKLLSRFLRYVQIDTQSDEKATVYPSSTGQLELGRLLVDELHALGLEDAAQDSHGIVLATVPPTAGKSAPMIAWIAHLDTSPETSGHNVRPIVHRDYDGGDIALHLADLQCYKIGLVELPDRPSLFGSLEITAADPVRGVATSGWRGRSFSLGIADAVTVLADCASAADAAATMIANAVNLPDHSGVTRVPAREISPDSDLGDLRVTRGVEPLSQSEIERALNNGFEVATLLREKGLIYSAALYLQKCVRVFPSEPERSPARSPVPCISNLLAGPARQAKTAIIVPQRLCTPGLGNGQSRLPRPGRRPW